MNVRWLIALALLVACGSKESPRVAPSASVEPGLISFISESSGHARAELIRTDGSARRALGPADRPSYPQGLLDAHRLALIVGQDGDDALFALALDSGALTPLSTQGGLHRNVRLAPGGQSLVFEAAIDGFRDLYRVSLAGHAEPERLTSAPDGSFDPAWSPDGRRLAFASSQNGQLDLYVMDLESRRATRLTRHPGDAVKPAWTHDGEQLVYLSARDGSDGLFLVPARGGEPVALTGPIGVDESFAVGSAGIAYAAPAPDGHLHLFVRPVPGLGGGPSEGPARSLSRPGDHDLDPSWSPTGATLVFTHTEAGVPNVWRMRADGTGRAPLTHEPGGAWRPRWLVTSTNQETAR